MNVKMKTLMLLQMSLAVTLAIPPFHPDVAKSPDLLKEEQSPLLGDSVPLQGHVEVEHPAPQARLSSEGEQGESPPAPVDVEQSESESVEGPEGKVEPRVDEVQTEVKMEPEIKAEPEVKVEQEVVVAPEDQVMPDVEAEQKFIAGEEVKEETEVQLEQGGQEKQEPEPQVNPEVNLHPDWMAELQVDEPNAEMEPELRADQAFKVEPELQENPEFNVMTMNLEAEPEMGRGVEESLNDAEGNYETLGEPVMEMELQDDGGMFGEEGSEAELSEMEESLRRAFQSQHPVVETLPEEEGLLRKRDNALGEEPIMDPEPEVGQEVMPDGGIMEDGPALDYMGEPLLPLASYFPNDEAWTMVDHEKQPYSLAADGSDYVMQMEEQRSEDPAGEDAPVLYGGDQMGVEKRDLMVERGYRCSAGVALEGKCYQFFKGPKRASDAEFFCQAQFPGGHLASITSHHIHQELMGMMLSVNGAHTRTWIGGLRYLETGRFIWLDGSQWTYADWLSGEPNHTSNLEHCVEVLSFGNGKFNDFTCWEPQAFICSHPYQ